MNPSARNIMISTILLATLLAAAPHALASIKIDVSNNSGGSNRVQVNSNQSVKINNETSSSNSKTTVKINQNGEEKTFESTGEDISYQSQDGTTKVEVKGNSTKTDVNSATKVQKSSGEHKETEESEDKNSDTQKSSSSEKRISFFDYIKIKIISFFSLSSRD